MQSTHLSTNQSSPLLNSSDQRAYPSPRHLQQSHSSSKKQPPPNSLPHLPQPPYPPKGETKYPLHPNVPPPIWKPPIPKTQTPEAMAVITGQRRKFTA